MGQSPRSGRPAIPPARYLEFVYPAGFARAWAGLGLDDDKDLLSLEVAIMEAPTCGRVIPGTGRIRKMRFVPPGWETGQSGATRVWYVYHQKYRHVLLVAVYDKTQAEDLTDAKKKALTQLAERYERWLASRATEAEKPRLWHRYPRRSRG